METKRLHFLQIVVNSDHIFGLDTEGDVWYRDKIPFHYTTSYSTSTYDKDKKEKEKKEKEGIIWKRLNMEGRVGQPDPEPVEPDKLVPVKTLEDSKSPTSSESTGQSDTELV